MGTASPKLLAALLMALSSAVFILAAVGISLKREPFFTWFYCYAWWSYILFAESLLHYRGAHSLVFTHWRRFLALLPLSVTFWLVFELFNFRLTNWHYVNVPRETIIRWLGYGTAFATVLPGIFTTRSLLDHFGIFKSANCTAPCSPSKLTHPFIFLGAASLLLPLFWPEYFFPLVWGGFIFLLEPINYRNGAPSLLRDWEQGSLRAFWLLLAAGLWCGFQWELLNYWAGSKWIYTVPYVGDLKLFEMPVLGFLGFPPFAVECYVMVNSFFLLFKKLELLRSARHRQTVWWFMAALALLFNLLIFAGIDHFTVKSFKP